MTESDFLVYCQSQVKGPLKDEDIILMLTAWGQISYDLGYRQGLKEKDSEKNNVAGTEQE